jgi:sulfur-oxidizing protein SoxX
MRAGLCAFALAALALGAVDVARAQATLLPYTIVGDAIPQSLTGKPGDPTRGRAIVLSRQTGLCILCHSGPFPGERFQGNMAPDLAGTGKRWTEGQLRLRVVDASRLNPATIMPVYYRTDSFSRVLPAFAAKPVLTAEQIEDVIAFLATLRD